MSREALATYDRLTRQAEALAARQRALIAEQERLLGELADYLTLAQAELWFAMIRPDAGLRTNRCAQPIDPLDRNSN